MSELFNNKHTFFDSIVDRGIIEGSVVLSKCGHDKGRVYVVLNQENSFLELVDGDKRKIEKPKQKRRKHVKLLGNIPDKENFFKNISERKDHEKNTYISKTIINFLDQSNA